MKNLFRVWSLTAFIFLFAASAYAAPVITSAAINSNNQITLKGTNLIYGAKTSTVVFNGVNYPANIGTPAKTSITAQLQGLRQCLAHMKSKS